METNSLAVFEQISESDQSCLEDNSTVILVPQSDQVIPGRSLADHAKFKDRVFRVGEQFLARLARNSEEGSEFREEDTSQPQTTASVVVSEIRGAEALPQSPFDKTETKRGSIRLHLPHFRV